VNMAGSLSDSVVWLMATACALLMVRYRTTWSGNGLVSADTRWVSEKVESAGQAKN
jgi:hypothetical protein